MNSGKKRSEEAKMEQIKSDKSCMLPPIEEER